MGRSVFASSLGLISTVVGVGVLTLPYSVARFGFVLGFFFIFGTQFLTGFTLYCMVWTSDRTGKYSFKTITESVFSRKHALVLASLIPCYCVLLLTGYTVLIGDIGSTILSEVTGFEVGSVWFTDRNIVSLILCYLVVFPLSSLPSLYALRHFSFLTLLSVVYLSVLLLTTAISKLFKAPLFPVPDDVIYLPFTFSKESFTAFSNISLAFACSLTIPTTFRELAPRTVKLMQRVINITFTIVGCCYVILCTSAYFLYGDGTNPNILLSLDKDSSFVALANGLFLAVVLIVYPVVYTGTREAITDLYADFKGLSPVHQSSLKMEGIHVIDVTDVTYVDDNSTIEEFRFQSDTASDSNMIGRRSSTVESQSNLTESDDESKTKNISRSSSLASLVSIASRKLSQISRRPSVIDSHEVALSLLESDHNLDDDFELPSIPAPRNTLEAITEAEIQGADHDESDEVEPEDPLEFSLSPLQRRILAFTVVTITYIGSRYSTNVAAVFGLSSASIGMILVFFFPCSVYWKSCSPGLFHKFLCCCCFVLGGILSVLGTWSSISSL
ncbi:hypothetical protein GEMRC1_003674 [Eukaryota sp. GEM-RC1]